DFIAGSAEHCTDDSPIVDCTREFAAADTIFVSHDVPAGSTYQVGSATLNGEPLADPTVAADGSLVWQLPYAETGHIRYTLQHTESLGALPEPGLGFTVNNRFHLLSGHIPSDLITAYLSGEAR